MSQVPSSRNAEYPVGIFYQTWGGLCFARYFRRHPTEKSVLVEVVSWSSPKSICQSVKAVCHLPLAAAWLIVAVDGACQAQSAAPAALQPRAVAAKFDTREIKAAAEPGVAVVELCYEFTNTGEIPLVVEEFSQACGCMQGSWNGVPVEPGARGKITAKLLTKGLRGTVRKGLHVKFVEGGVVELMGEVKIPEALSFTARTLHWNIGEAATPREVEIAVHSKKPVRVLSVGGGQPAFSCTLAAIEEGRRYRVTITPRDTVAERVGIFQVRTDATDPRDALQGLFALVERSKPRGGPP